MGRRGGLYGTHLDSVTGLKPGPQHLSGLYSSLNYSYSSSELYFWGCRLQGSSSTGHNYRAQIYSIWTILMPQCTHHNTPDLYSAKAIHIIYSGVLFKPGPIVINKHVLYIGVLINGKGLSYI